jgi:uncharacterized repeat protein (TIGR01451 family)
MIRRLLLCAIALGAFVTPAHAQVVRTFTARYSINAPGDITVLGNTLMTCPGNGQCAQGQGGTGNRTDDNDFDMEYVDIDADAATFSSSTANLTLPAGSTVQWAGLYWGGDSNNGSRNTCRFRTPLAGYATQTSTQTDVSGATRYSCFRDVTALVQAGGSGTYGAANVYSTPGTSDVYAGWSLIVVYRDVTKPNRNLVVADGYALVSNTATVTWTVNGFVTPPSGPVSTRVGVVTYEGDIGLTGDSFRLNGVTLSDAVNPATNFFNSTISSLGAHVATKNPNYVNQYGFDIDLLNANGLLANGATSATISCTTNGDTFYPTVLTFATDLYAPVMEGNSFTKSVTDVNGGSAQPGDVLEYTVRIQNTGQDNAVNTVFRDTLASNLTYVPGSFSIVNGPNPGAKTDATGDDQVDYIGASRILVARLGTGANQAVGGTVSVGVQTTVRFRATITAPVPNGTVVANQGGLAFNAAQLGTAFSTRSDADTVTAGFQPTATTVVAPVMSGVVFEDVNYGGGAGRTRAASSGVLRPGARVELYSSSGALLLVATTDALGAYAFDGWSPGSYTVRVASSTVLSSRPGASASNLGVQTFRTVATTGSAVADAARVGGETPSLPDAGPNVTNRTLAQLSNGTTVAQSIAPVTLASASIAGIDFGFNFDTVVNVNDDGQGSLRLFLLNAASLANTGLAQVGQAAGVEASIFMVADGLAHPGLRAGLPNLLTAGVARINVLSTLPWVSDASTRLDGATQTANVGDTNAGALGAGGTVGAAGLALATVARPEVEIVDGANLAAGLDLRAASSTVRDLAVRGFGNATGANTHGDLLVQAAATGALLENLVLGTLSTSFADPGAALRSGGDHVRAIGATAGTLRNSLVGWGQGSGVALVSGANGWSITGCQVESNALGAATSDGIGLSASSSATIRGNLVRGSLGMGIDARTSTGLHVIAENTVSGNGTGGSETAGVGLGSMGTTLDRNELAQNSGAGVLVLATSSGNVITRNSIWGNGPVSGQVGIDLLSGADDSGRGTSPYRTRNDAGDGDAGGNALLNFPVITTATVGGGNLTVSGFARPGVTIELFVSDSDPSGFGEGRTYVATFVEGSGTDLDATTGTYAGTINGVDQGGDTTNRFRFTIATPPGVFVGAFLAATATLAGVGTSEFSGRDGVGGGVAVSGFAYSDANHDSGRDPGEDGTGAALWVKLVTEPFLAAADQVALVDPVTGAWSFAAVSAGPYSFILDDNGVASDVTPTMPTGWIATQAAPGARPGTLVASTELTNLDFGLYHGSRVDGRVVKDDGAGGGTANDGAGNGGETGVAGVFVDLAATGCASGLCDSTLTDGAGAFRLFVPWTASGVASVRETNPPLWVSTGGRAGTTGGTHAGVLTFTPAAGVLYTGVEFGDVPPNTFMPGGAQNVGPGAAALYAHRFSAGTAGTVAFGASQIASLPGWTMDLVRDLNCNSAIDAGEPLVSAPLAVVAGQAVCLVARHASPAGAPAGANAQATLTASFTYSPTLSGTSTLVDVTTVLGGGGGLSLTKGVDVASARPGDVLTYTITYTNLGATPLSAIVIQDATPAFTVFTSAGCGALGSGLGGCAVSTEPAVGAAGSVRWTLSGSLLPGASGTVTYQVRVQ